MSQKRRTRIIFQYLRKNGVISVSSKNHKEHRYQLKDGTEIPSRQVYFEVKKRYPDEFQKAIKYFEEFNSGGQ